MALRGDRFIQGDVPDVDNTPRIVVGIDYGTSNTGTFAPKAPSMRP